MLKKIISLVLILLLSVAASPFAFAEPAPEVSAKSAILINADNLDILFAKDENTKRPMASTTKIMTAFLTLEEAAKNNRVITITEKMVQVEGSSMGLRPGDMLSLKSLAAGMLTVSGNDAANAAAIAVSGSTQAFAERMNRRAQELHLTSTHFITPSGLDAEGHYSTARDMAVLAAAAMKNPDFSTIVGKRLLNVSYVSPELTRRLTNHNKLLALYKDCVGVKTGFTKKSGRCLVSAAERDGIRLIAVTLNAPDDWDDHQKMLNYGFGKLTGHRVDDSSFSVPLPVVGGASDQIAVNGADGGSVVTDSGQEFTRTVELPKFVYAPVQKGQVIGAVRYRAGSKIVAETKLTAAESVSRVEPEKNWFQKFWDGILELFPF